MVVNLTAIDPHHSDEIMTEPLGSMCMVKGRVLFCLPNNFLFAMLLPVGGTLLDLILKPLSGHRSHLEFLRREGSIFFEIIEQLNDELTVVG